MTADAVVLSRLIMARDAADSAIEAVGEPDGDRERALLSALFLARCQIDAAETTIINIMYDQCRRHAA